MTWVSILALRYWNASAKVTVLADAITSADKRLINAAWSIDLLITMNLPKSITQSTGIHRCLSWLLFDAYAAQRTVSSSFLRGVALVRKTYGMFRRFREISSILGKTRKIALARPAKPENVRGNELYHQ